MTEKQHEGRLVTIHPYPGGVTIVLEKDGAAKAFILSNKLPDYEEMYATLLAARTVEGVVRVWYEERDGSNFMNGGKW